MAAPPRRSEALREIYPIRILGQVHLSYYIKERGRERGGGDCGSGKGEGPKKTEQYEEGNFLTTRF